MGDQDLWGLIFPGVATYRRKIFNFNLTNRIIQMISGYQRRNRKSTICIPVQSPMQQTADQFTKCLYHVYDTAGAHQIHSDCFERGALTQGISLLSIYKDLTNDPISGDIKFRYVDFKSILIDPFFRQRDLSDCRFIWTRQFFDKHEAALLFPEHADELLRLPPGTYRDERFYYMPEVYQIQFPNLIAWDEYWYLSSREATYLIDKETEEVQEWRGDEEQLRDRMREKIKRPDGTEAQAKDIFKVIKKRRPTVRRSVSVNDRTFIDEDNPYGMDRYPFVPCVGYMNADTPYYAYKFRGVARDLRDAQYLFNRRKVADLDILEAQQQGIKLKKGALVTPEDALNQGHGRVLAIDPAFQMSDVEHMPIIPPAPTMIQMEDLLKNIMTEISGVNEELLGSAVDDKAGILSMLRQGAGLTTLQKLFDQFDEFQQLAGEIVIEMIQNNWTYGKVRQVIDEEPTFEFDQKLFFKYGAKIVPGVLTESQKQLEAQQLIYLRSELGMPISTNRILSALTFQEKDEVIKETMAAEQAQQEQQKQMAQLQMQQLSVENETKLAYARSQDGLAKERTAKIQLDAALNAERLQRAQEDKASSLLNLIKAVKEIKDMDLDQLMKGISVLDALEQKNATQTLPIEQEVQQ